MKTFNQFLDEAKQEEKSSPLEKEDIRNERAFGSTRSRDRATGVRRTLEAATRNVKKQRGSKENYATKTIPDSRSEVRNKIEKLKGYKRGRDFAKKVKRELALEKAKKHIDVANAASNIKPFNNRRG
jgi:hypothetical protein